MRRGASVVTDPLFRLRAGHAGDHPLVVDSWVKSYQGYALARDCEHCGGAGRIYRGNRFLRGHKRLVREILARPGAALLVACRPDDPDTILGWACTGPGKVFYVFVKKDVRRVGIAKALLAPYLDARNGGVIYTHRCNLEAPAHWTYDHHANVWDFEDDVPKEAA